ncbi:MAG: hypothetical protein IT323_12540 [Anaerolineae bacterium]|nr:hypothetical protein [Anaerolineae bacterium]
MPQPLPLPAGFNPDTNMIARVVDGRTYHSIIPAVRWAPALVENGTPEDLAQAERTIRALIACQETHPDDPHYGNFFWEREDEAVEDLNAVQFILFNFIPIMVQYQDRLSPSLQQDMLASIRLGLDEIRRLDVHPAYTNIVLKDISNSCLGGELLGDAAIAQRGYDKLLDWMRLTDQNGIPTEFNSPPYADIAIRVLHSLSTLVRHAETRMRARVMLYRLGLSIALHIHTPTGRLAGPYSRAYRPSVFGETPPEIVTFREWLRDGILPGWFADLLTYRGDQMQVAETSDAEKGVGITTFHSPSFALGVASHELDTQANRFIALQSNVCIAHYRVPDPDQVGVALSRYILDDKWVGDFRTTPSREADQLLPEEGRFLGVQDGPRMIGLYCPRELGAWSRCQSAKAAILWLHRQNVDAIWVGGREVQALPADVLPGDTVVVSSGSALIAVRPLQRTDLGRNAPLRLVEIDGHLALEMYNYLGPAKTFWEMATPGSFYQGQPQCGFYLEIAEKSEHTDGRAFGEMVARGNLTDHAEPPVTNDAGRERLWRVEYSRDGAALGLEIDLLGWRLRSRWNHLGEMGWPMLDAPAAAQTRTGCVQIGAATLTCGEDAAWLVALPERNLWVAAYHGAQPAPFSLTVPAGRVDLDQMGTGIVTWNNGIVTVEALDMAPDLKIVGGWLA